MIRIVTTIISVVACTFSLGTLTFSLRTTRNMHKMRRELLRAQMECEIWKRKYLGYARYVKNDPLYNLRTTLVERAKETDDTKELLDIANILLKIQQETQQPLIIRKQ